MLDDSAAKGSLIQDKHTAEKLNDLFALIIHNDFGVLYSQIYNLHVKSNCCFKKNGNWKRKSKQQRVKIQLYTLKRKET